MRERIAGNGIVILLVMMVFVFSSTGAALAATAYTKTLDSTFSIVAEPQAKLAFYSDAGATQPVASISFGTLYAGKTSAPLTLYVKNVGNIPFNSVTAGANPGLATLSCAPNGFPLPVGAVQQIVLKITAGTTLVPDGKLPITFTCN